MDVREKLVELIFKSLCRHIHKSCKLAENIADDLIADGVTVQDNTEISDELLERLRKAPVTVMTEEPTVEVVQEWISVKDRLPEESGEYLTYCGEYDGICILYCDVIKTKIKWRTRWKEVTHWQPMPQPPKGE